MSLVPGYAHDLFLSYAHFEAGWVEAFKKALCQEFQEREGKPVSIWHDANNLRLGQKWTTEIEEGVKRAAALLAIVSPGYQNSDWCQEERNILIYHHGGLEGLRVDTIYRFLKILKSPSDYDLLGELQHVKFFKRRYKRRVPARLPRILSRDSQSRQCHPPTVPSNEQRPNQRLLGARTHRNRARKEAA